MKNSFKDLRSKKKHSKSSSRQKQQYKLRQQIAVETARLMSEEGIDNLQNARKKAAHELGIHDEHVLPDDKEILYEVKIHQSLYQSSSHEQLLKNLRATALNAMKLFNVFKPRLMGSVLLGHAHEHSSIDILLMADSPEEIAVLLMAHDIPYQLRDWKLYFSKPKSKSRSKHNTQAVPAYQFYADKHLINLIVLSENQRKLTPLNPGNWQAIQKASLTQVEAMLE
ncbi:MAG: hypothetical protein KAI22_06415 [Gammaproteobacteria bacterium]|nr:hypothetical protein [Gammaproteobacteria bacterium]